MSHSFAEDQKLWDDSNTPFEHPYAIWSFSSNKLYIGSMEYLLSPDDDHRAAFELGLFDVHYTYWKSRAKDIDDNRGYFYHSRLRSALEAHFRHTTSECLACPPILQPWLWRTFCLCPQTQKGRSAFIEVATRYNILMDGSQPPINSNFWHKSIRSSNPDGFSKYLPNWLQVAKNALGVPKLTDRLHCWQFDCFSSHIPDSVATLVHHFSHNPLFAFLSKEEKRTTFVSRIMIDPTFLRDSTNHHSINAEHLQRLKPGKELNSNIINIYLGLCHRQANKNKKAVVTTFFWPQICLGSASYPTATKFLFRALTDEKLSKCQSENNSRLCHILDNLESLLIPINYNSNHWLLFIMDFKAKCFHFCDSVTRVVGNKGRDTIIKTTAKYFQKEFEFDVSSWDRVSNSNAPQQFSEFDCGVYMCQFAKISLFVSYSDIPTVVEPGDMLDWRKMMVLELVSGKIRWANV